MMQAPKFKYLVLGGGGVKGMSLPGVYSVLKKSGLLDSVKVYAGVSVGAIMSFLIVCGYTSQQIARIFLYTKLERFFTEVTLSSLLKNEGSYFSSGDDVKEFISRLLEDRGMSRTITLKELHEKSNLVLLTLAFDRTIGKLVKYNCFDHPDKSVVDAVYESMTIPILFKPNTYREADSDVEHVMLDGGMIENNPFHHFPLEETLCVRLGKRFKTRERNNTNEENIDNGVSRSVFRNMFSATAEKIKFFIGDVYDMLATVHDYVEYESLKDKEFYEIVVDIGTVNTLHTKITIDEKLKLFLSGVASAVRFANNPRKTIPIVSSNLYLPFNYDEKIKEKTLDS